MRKLNKKVLVFFLNILKTVFLRFLQSKLLSLMQKGLVKLLKTDLGKQIQEESQKRLEKFVVKKVFHPRYDFLYYLKVTAFLMFMVVCGVVAYAVFEFMFLPV